MISAPFHSIQTALPGNVRVRDFSDGRRGIEIDGNGAANPTGFSQRITLSQGETRSIRSSVLVQSTLVSAANGYEGIGFDLKCLIRDGLSTTPLMTWTNAPFRSGEPKNLFNEQYSEWTLISDIVHVPYDVPVEFIDCAWAVRGSSGQARFASASLRNSYQESRSTSIGAADWSSLGTENVLLAGAKSLPCQVKYIDAYAVRCPKYAEVKLQLNSYIKYAGYYGILGTPVTIILMIGLKMRRKDGGYDWWTTAVGNPEGSGGGGVPQMNNASIDMQQGFIAQSEYTQFEVVLVVAFPNGEDQFSLRSVWHEGMKIEVLINDPIRSGSQ